MGKYRVFNQEAENKSVRKGGNRWMSKSLKTISTKINS